MTTPAALHRFFNGFGIPAYPSTAVPDGATCPYMTYQVYTGGYTGEVVYPTVNIYYRTDSEAEPNAKAEELRQAIGSSGKLIEVDTGFLWLFEGSPWCQPLTDDNDPTLKRRYINIAQRFLTL